MRLALWRWCIAVALLAMAGAPLAAPEAEDLANRRSVVERQRADLRARIQTLQKELDAREAVRKEAADALKVSEVAISQTTRRLNELGTQLKKARTELEALKTQIQRQQLYMFDRTGLSIIEKYKNTKIFNRFRRCHIKENTK
jgi:chromosome segregation ATPase